MDELLWLRVLLTFLVDGSVALLCGFLLSSLWLRSVHSALGKDDQGILGREEVCLGVFAALLFVALCGQLLFLSISFSGQTSIHAVMLSMPDVCSTHAGEVSLALCGVAAALCLATRIPSSKRRTSVCGVLVLSCLCLHAWIGHASSDGNVSLAELFQVIHLLGMATWSGGVMVSGLLVVPRLCLEPARETSWPSGATALAPMKPTDLLAEYLGKLSLVSTCAVGAVLLSGLIKAYLATEGSLQVVRTSQWGQILTVKAALVTLAVLLGAKNRWLLASAARWDASSARSSARTLRLEALAMLAVLLLSAWLASTPPPLD